MNLSAVIDKSKPAICGVLWVVNIALWTYIDLVITRFVLGALLVLANFVVWYGVYLEKESFPKEKQDKGWRILIRGLAAETTIGLLLLAVDTSLGMQQKTEIAATQQNAALAYERAANAEREAGNLGVKVDKLPEFVAQKNKEITDATGDFRRVATEQKKHSDEVIASLRAEQKEVAATLEAAKKDEAILAASVNTIKELRDELHDLTADRLIDIERIAAQLKSFGKIRFVLEISDDDETNRFTLQLMSALEKAEWEQQDNKPSDNSLEFVKNFLNKPKMRVESGRGIAIRVAEGDVKDLEKPATALFNALQHENLKYVTAEKVDDENMGFHKWLYGVIHIRIGVRH